MASRVSAASETLLPAAAQIEPSATNEPFPWSDSRLPAPLTEPKSWPFHKGSLSATGLEDFSRLRVSSPAKLGVEQKEDAISFNAEDIGGLTLHPSARIIEYARVESHFVLKVISVIQAERLEVTDLLNGVTDPRFLQIRIHGNPKIRCQDTDKAARSIAFYPLASFSSNLSQAVFVGSRFSSEQGDLNRDGWLLVSQICNQIIRSETQQIFEPKKTQIYGQTIFRRQGQTSSSLRQLPLSHPPDLPEDSSAFQIQVNFLGKTTMLWVHAADLVQDLLQKLECRLGIPSSCLRLLYQGKQLMQPLSLSFYSIQKDASIGVSFHLRGGSFGQTSSAPFFSYRDATRKNTAQPQASSKTALPNGVPKPFLVEKSEEIPSISLSNPGVENRYQTFAESGLICRFNGLWPRTTDLYQWVHSFWTKKCKIFLCSKGFFLVVFYSNEDYQKALTRGPWFWGTTGLFLTPWFPDFDPSTAVISKIPIWVRLPNLPAHFWDFSVFLAIGNTLGRYLATDTSRRENGLYTYDRLCAEIDISKGLPDQINLKFGDFHWTQSLDYENTAFRCRHCHQTGHLQSTCSQLKDKKKNLNRKSKSKRWNPFEPPHPLGDLHFSSSEEGESEADLQVDEEVEADMQNEEILGDPPSAVPEAPSNPQISQKRAHFSSSSDLEKEAQLSDQNHLQLVTSQPTGWTKVNKKKRQKMSCYR